MTNPPVLVFQVKITLLGTKPPIWRRVLLPSHMTLEVTSAVILTAMGWNGGHLHEFVNSDGGWGPKSPFEDHDGEAPRDEARTLVSDLFSCVGGQAHYLYDFGDDWDHQLVLEKIIEPEPGLTLPLCVAGQFACPPEDCGGIPGFYDFLSAMANPKHPQHAELLEWHGGRFDPEAFSVEEVNRRFVPSKKRASAGKRRG